MNIVRFVTALAVALSAAVANAQSQGAKQPAEALANVYTEIHRSAAPGRPLPPLMRPINASEVQIGRYTTQSLLADEEAADPLKVVAKVHLPRPVVQTVGDAVRYVLLRTGYDLPAVEHLDERVRQVFGRRLPESQRVLGPYRVETMLQVLMGRAFNLTVDPVARLVAYAPAQAGQTLAETAQRATQANNNAAEPAAVPTATAAR